MDLWPSSSTRRRALGLSLIVLGTGLSGCSAGSEAAAARRAIAGGSADTSHDSVFLLIARLEDGGGLCTATLIAPNLLLTARHCVSPRDDRDAVLCGQALLGEPYPAEAFIATNAAAPDRESPFFRAAEVRVPVQGEDTCGYDIALVILEGSVPSELASPAVPRIDREVSPGEAYTAVGYGENEDGNSTGARMRLEGLSVACEPGSCGAGVESTEFLGDTGICSGDSGGPALDGDGKVVGVVSRGGPDCSTPIYGTVTAWRDFLTATAADAARLGGYEAPFWATTGSSDPPEVPGAGGAGSVVDPGSEGDPCSAAASCGEGLVCYAATGAEASCVAGCVETADCAAGHECRALEGGSVCVPPSGGLDESGCSVSTPSSSPRGGSAVMLLLALSALGWARRRI